jgi:hypothetical protein
MEWVGKRERRGGGEYESEGMNKSRRFRSATDSKWRIGRLTRVERWREC